MMDKYGVFLAALALLGSGIGTYASLSASIASAQNDIDDLDAYDIRLQVQVDDLSGRVGKVENVQSVNSRDVGALSETMKDMLKEIKQLNETLIRMEK